MALYLGLDTSNYTTSAALCDDTGNILVNQKLLLPVRPGERGLRQSDAVFLHVKALPQIAAMLREHLPTGETLSAIGVSRAPRDSAGSYMPCFLVGEGAGEVLSAALRVPLYMFSHQAGHVMAAAYSASRNGENDLDALLAAPFLAFHVSGGTTDILLAQPDAEKILSVQHIGGTLDLNAGQVIDRTGVKMGLSFPCGAAMDTLALRYTGRLRRDRLSVHDFTCNLSGVENKAAGLYDETGDPAATSAYVLATIGRTLEELTKNLRNRYPDLPILYAGGVMSSRYIRQILSPYGSFAEAQFSSDNASGVCLLARKTYLRLKDTEL